MLGNFFSRIGDYMVQKSFRFFSYARWLLDQLNKSVKGAEFFIALGPIRITIFAVYQVDIQFSSVHFILKFHYIQMPLK